MQAAGIEFSELGNTNATDGPLFKRTSLFTKDIQFISDEALEKLDLKTGRRILLQLLLALPGIVHKNRELLSGIVDFEQKNNHWLQTYALFPALSQCIGIKEFPSWPESIRNNDRKLRGVISKQSFDRIMSEKTARFLVCLSFRNLTERAKQIGIFIGRTAGILCKEFSSDVWGNRRLFFVDKRSKANGWNMG